MAYHRETLLDLILKPFGLISKKGCDLQVQVAMRKQWNDITGTPFISVPGLDRF